MPGGLIWSEACSIGSNKGVACYKTDECGRGWLRASGGTSDVRCPWGVAPTGLPSCGSFFSSCGVYFLANYRVEFIVVEAKGGDGVMACKKGAAFFDPR